jgi:hypothetical protein
MLGHLISVIMLLELYSSSYLTYGSLMIQSYEVNGS